MFLRHNILPLFALFLLILAVPVTVDLAGKAQDYFSRAAAVPADITVDFSRPQAPFLAHWTGMAQGGELESDNYRIVPIESTLSKMKSLGVRYVRLDHILNRPLEERMATIRAIKSAGLTPFIALSYFSSSMADKDTGPVKNWGEWERAVENLVSLVSRDTEGVYYEVWNEPDGKDFGNMSARQYVELYRRTVAAASRAKNVKDFKIGGPALANPDNKKWMQEFIFAVAEENLRLDFLSWHRYHRNNNVFVADLDLYDGYLSLYPRFFGLPKVISEWGTDPQPNAIHNSIYDTAHYVFVSRDLLNRVEMTAKFEIRDGFRNINDRNGLGVVDYNLTEKPPIMALRVLQKLSGALVALNGEGSNVKAFATVDGNKHVLLLVNFDYRSGYSENTPVKISFGPDAIKVSLKKTIVDRASPFGRVETSEIELPNGEFTFTQPMLVNSIVVWEMVRV